MSDLIAILLIILLHFVIYSIPPVIGSFMEGNNQILLNYTYLGVLFTLVQLFDNVYGILISQDFGLNGGDIAYSALIFATLYLISTQPDPKVVRNLIYIFIINTTFLFLLFGLLSQVLNSDYMINYLSIPSIFLEFSYKSLLFSLFLYSSEIILVLVMIRKLTKLVTSSRLIALGFGVAYYIVLIIDGILYPIGINILFPNTNLSVSNGVFAKLIFGAGFGTILVLLLCFRPKNLSEFIAEDRPLIEYLIPPRVSKLKQQLVQAEEKIQKLEEIIPICARCKKIRDDEGYWSQLEEFMSTHKDMTFTHGLCPDCVRKAIAEVDKYSI